MTNRQQLRLKELAKDLPKLMQKNNFHLLNEFRKLQEIHFRDTYEATGICMHEIVQGDGNGESCKICSKQIRGFGYGGLEKRCIHQFLRIEKTFMGECQYCKKVNARFITN